MLEHIPGITQCVVIEDDGTVVGRSLIICTQDYFLHIQKIISEIQKLDYPLFLQYRGSGDSNFSYFNDKGERCEEPFIFNSKKMK